uniref:Uncharacterized protein n=1 Tax=Mandrillus leucophaeus TaxID=9568 RepID=A0A2K5XGW5_MANLE
MAFFPDFLIDFLFALSGASFLRFVPRKQKITFTGLFFKVGITTPPGISYCENGYIIQLKLLVIRC